MPPNMRILVRGAGLVLGLTFVVAGLAGIVTMNPLIALNSLGFIGICALSSAVIFYAVALERIGLTAARTAAHTLVLVLGGSASLMTILFFVLVSQDRFWREASQWGFHSAAGAFVLLILVGALVLVLRDR